MCLFILFIFGLKKIHFCLLKRYSSQVLTSGGVSDSFVQGLFSALNGKTEQQFENISTETDDESLRKIFFMSSRKKDISINKCYYSNKYNFLQLKLNEFWQIME